MKMSVLIASARNINGKMIKMEIKKTVGDLFAETKQAPRAKL